MRIMCLDIGDKRIGVAVTDALGIIAQPYKVIEVTNRKQALQEIISIATSLNINLVVIGMPYNQEGILTVQANKNLYYANRLREIFNIDFCDESYSTIDAYDSLKEMGISNLKEKKSIDKISASLILQRYLARERV